MPTIWLLPPRALPPMPATTFTSPRHFSARPGTWFAGEEADVIGLLALVTDFDKGHDPETRHERLPFATWCEVESSPGNYPVLEVLRPALSCSEVKPLLGALVNVLGVDTCKSCEHVYRVPGTLNYPNATKLKAGRSPDPVRGRLVPEFDRDIFAPDMTLDAVKASMVAKFGATVFDTPAELRTQRATGRKPIGTSGRLPR